MKYFTQPDGKFVIEIPIEWQYKNVAVGDENPPYSFELYENHIGCFQVSCYELRKGQKKKGKIQNFDTDSLEFITKRMDRGGFNMHYWFATVEDHMFMATYTYDSEQEKSERIKAELIKAENSLKTLRLISPEKREDVLNIDRYEKFMASLAASFDLLSDSIENGSAIPIVILIANQIDAYLRLSLVMSKQLSDNTNKMDIALLYQGENDKPITERKIYSLAKNEKIIDEELFEELEKLYKVRNKMVHRYIISEFRTRDIYDLSIGYIEICEKVRLILEEIENRQFAEKIGIYGGDRNPQDEHSAESIRFLHSQVNDKHLVDKHWREINTPNN